MGDCGVFLGGGPAGGPTVIGGGLVTFGTLGFLGGGPTTISGVGVLEV